MLIKTLYSETKSIIRYGFVYTLAICYLSMVNVGENWIAWFLLFMQKIVIHYEKYNFIL